MLAETERLPKEVHLTQAGLGNLPVGWNVVEIGELLCDDRGISVGVMYPGEHDPIGIPLIKVGEHDRQPHQSASPVLYFPR